MKLVTRSIDANAVRVFDTREFQTFGQRYTLHPEGLRVRRYRVPMVLGSSNSVRELIGSASNLRIDATGWLLADLKFASDLEAQVVRRDWLTGELSRLEPVIQITEHRNQVVTQWLLLSLRIH